MAAGAEPRVRTGGTLLSGLRAAAVLQACGVAIRYGSEAVFARVMGAGEYGRYAYAFSLAQLLAIVAGIGLGTAVMRLVPQYLVEGDAPRLRGLSRWTRGLTLAAGCVVALMTWLVAWGFGLRNGEMIALGAWVVPLVALVNLQRDSIRGADHVIAAFAPPLIVQPLVAVTVTLGVVAMGRPLTAGVAVAVLAGSLIVTGAIQLVLFRWTLPHDVRVVAPAYEWREWVGLGVPFLGAAVFGTVLAQVDVLVVGALLGSHETGIYSAAARTAMLVSAGLSMVNTTLPPMIARLHATGDRAALNQLFVRAARWTLWPALAATAGLLLFGKRVLGIFGPDFQAGYIPLVILAVGHCLNGAAGPVSYLMNLTGNQRATARVLGWSALIALVLQLISVPLFGLIGAAVATALSMFIWSAWLASLAWTRLRIGAFHVGDPR